MSILRIALATALAVFPTLASAAYVCGTNPNGDYFLSMRTCASTQCPEIARLVEGHRMMVIRSQGAWLYVAAGEQVGYVHSAYVCY